MDLSWKMRCRLTASLESEQPAASNMSKRLEHTRRFNGTIYIIRLPYIKQFGGHRIVRARVNTATDAVARVKPVTLLWIHSNLELVRMAMERRFDVRRSVARLLSPRRTSRTWFDVCRNSVNSCQHRTSARIASTKPALRFSY